ncbi:MAG: esterase/lipase family protein [Candidatus Binatus sp.]
MNSRTVITEIAAAGALIGSYPLDWLVRRGEPYFCAPSSEPVILIHGFGGSRSNLLALAAYLRLSGFDNVSYFEYPRWQTLADSAAQLGRVAEEKSDGNGVHLIGHSLGGTVARRYAAGAPDRTVRSLITLGSPYSYGQWSPRELGVFGDDDPIVPAPIEMLTTRVTFARIVTLHDVGHLALVFHPEVLRIVATELRANRAPESKIAA